MTPITKNYVGIDGHVFEDRRGEPRRRSFKGGRLSFNRGYGALECVVRNQSSHGALLSFGDSSAVPPTFDLVISGDQLSRRAEVRWRSLTAVGVRLADHGTPIGQDTA